MAGKKKINAEEEKARKRRINKTIKQFENIFKCADDNKNAVAKKIYTEIAFMEETLRELKNTINSEGATIIATNGNGFKVPTENPAQKSYNTMIRNYNGAIKNLAALLPRSVAGDDTNDAFERFIESRDDI
jgi:hypothetical protein